MSDLTMPELIFEVCKENGFKLIYSCYAPNKDILIYIYKNKHNYYFHTLLTNTNSVMSIDYVRSTYSGWKTYNKDEVNATLKIYCIDYRL